jgi:hypothetical protein
MTYDPRAVCAALDSCATKMMYRAESSYPTCATVSSEIGARFVDAIEKAFDASHARAFEIIERRRMGNAADVQRENQREGQHALALSRSRRLLACTFLRM